MARAHRELELWRSCQLAYGYYQRPCEEEKQEQEEVLQSFALFPYNVTVAPIGLTQPEDCQLGKSEGVVSPQGPAS